MRAYRPTSAIALIAIVVAAGCGSGDDGGGTTTAAAPAAPARRRPPNLLPARRRPSPPATVGTTAADDSAARTDWANSICSPLATWKAEVAAVGTVAGDGADLSQAALQDAAGKLETATATLTSGLKDVGAPPTPDGEEAKQQVDQLSDDLNSGVDKIKSDTANVSDAASFATAAAAVAATATTMAGQITSTVSALRSLDANGDWEKAFSQAASCDSIGGS